MIDKRKRWIYFRYIYPSIAALITIIMLFVPCFRFISEAASNDAISVFELTQNTWKWGTQCLWGNGIEQSVGNIYFSQTTLIMVAVFYLLFIVAVIVSVYLTVSAFMYFSDNTKGEKNRVFLITFLFNRIVVSILQLLTVPLFLFPRLLPSVYMSTLNTYVELRLDFIDPLIVIAILNVVGMIISIISAKYEKSLKMNLFEKLGEK